jgi:hypothetical protein
MTLLTGLALILVVLQIIEVSLNAHRLHLGNSAQYRVKLNFVYGYVFVHANIVGE